MHRYNIAHIAALRGDTDSLGRIVQNQRELLGEANFDGENIVHLAAIDGEAKVFDWIATSEEDERSSH